MSPKNTPALRGMNKSFAHAAGKHRRKWVGRPIPVGRSADGAQLPQNLSASLLDECNCALDERFAPEVRLRLALGGELLLHDVLGGDSGVVSAGNPERFVPDHTAPAY